MTEEIITYQTYPLIHKQDYFILNHFKNQKINSNNKKTNEKIQKKDSVKSKSKSYSQKQFPVKRSYGRLPNNYKNHIQLNSKAQVQDNKLVADCLVKSHLIESQYRSQQNKKHEKKQQMLKIHPVDVKKYHEQKHLQEISDAYYRVGQIRQQSQNRQKMNKQKMERVKTLSRSKSKQSGIQFRNKQKHNQQLIKQTMKLKQEYCDIKIPRIMGKLHNDVQVNIQSKTIYPACHQVSQKTLQKSANTRIFMSTKQDIFKNSKIDKYNQKKETSNIEVQNQTRASKVKSFKSNFNTNTNESSSLQKSKLVFSHFKNDNDYQSYNQNQASSQLRNQINSRQKEQAKMRKFLNKCKSQKDFKQIQRRKIVTDGFIKNWEQGPYLQKQNLECKYTQKLEQQKRNRMPVKKQNESHKIINNKELFDYQNNLFSRHQMLKRYEIKFLQTSRNIPILSSRF